MGEYSQILKDRKDQLLRRRNSLLNAEDKIEAIDVAIAKINGLIIIIENAGG